MRDYTLLRGRTAIIRGLLPIIIALAGTVVPARAFQLDGAFLTAMPTWIYNGFTVDGDGEPVQGSDTSPRRMTFGAGMDIGLNRRHRLEPQLWIYLQEYAALHDYNKTVPTQIETGSFLADVSNTLSIALSLPWLYTLPWPAIPDWQFSAGTGVALIFRIPLNEIDDSDGSAVGQYWIDGRYVYPHINLAADYQLDERYRIGAGLEWYIPIYHLWVEQEEPAPFLDETMIRFGLRIRRLLSGS